MQTQTRVAAYQHFGHVINRHSTGREAMIEGKLDWRAEKRPLYTPQGILIPNHFGVFRSDKERDIEGFLGSVKGRYQTIQAEQIFEFGDAVIETDPDRRAHYECAGSTGKGERGFAVINLSKTIEPVPGDTHEVFLCLSWSHDGNSSGRAFLIDTRSACANTIEISVKRPGRAGKDFSGFVFRHTSGVIARMAAARRILSEASVAVDDFAAKLKILASRELSSALLAEVTNKLFPQPPENVSDAAKTAALNRREKFLYLFEQNDGDRGFSLIRNTPYNALNAFTEYVDHEVSVVCSDAKNGWTREEIRSERALFGTGGEQKQSALETILEATRFAPTIDRTITYSFANNPANLLDSILDRAAA